MPNHHNSHERLPSAFSLDSRERKVKQSTKKYNKMENTTTQDTTMNDEETDQLIRSVYKPKERTNGKDSFKEKLIFTDNNKVPLDLGNDFYLIKINSQEIYNKALQQGPWFIGSQYLSIRQWKPKFNPYDAKSLTTTMWIHLQDLPTEFYDLTILKRISQMLGTLLKMDNCTTQATRG